MSVDKYKLVIYFHLAALLQLEILCKKCERRGRNDTSEISVHRECSGCELAEPREDLLSVMCSGSLSPVQEIM